MKIIDLEQGSECSDSLINTTETPVILGVNPPSKGCLYYYNKYVDKLSNELEGCTEDFKIREAVFSTFNHLSIYFPDAYQHMLKVWGVYNA